MRRLLAAAAAGAAAVALGAAPAASADAGAIADPRGDLWTKPSGNYGSFDIVRASYGHGSRGRLVHKLTLDGAAPNPATSDVPLLLTEDPVEPNLGTSYCRYFVGRFEGRLGIFTCGYGERVAGARITRTGSNTLRYELSARALGNPVSYDWAFVTRAASQGTVANVDRAPQGDHSFSNHQLR